MYFWLTPGSISHGHMGEAGVPCILTPLKLLSLSLLTLLPCLLAGLTSTRLVCHFYCMAWPPLGTLDDLQHDLWVPQTAQWRLLLGWHCCHSGWGATSLSAADCPAPAPSAPMTAASSPTRCHRFKGPRCLWSGVELGRTPSFSFLSPGWSRIMYCACPRPYSCFSVYLPCPLPSIIADPYMMLARARHCGEALHTLIHVILMTDLGGRNTIIVIFTEARAVNLLTDSRQLVSDRTEIWIQATHL